MHIKDFAREHGYRVRNLHDGFPVPPVTRKRGTSRSRGYSEHKGDPESSDDVHWAIPCKHGYVDGDGWTLLLDSGRKLYGFLRRFRKLGVIVAQRGDTEACGTVPPGRFGELLEMMSPYKVSAIGP